MHRQHITGRLTACVLGLLLVVGACDDSNPAALGDPVELATFSVENLPADPPTQVGADGRPQGTGQYTFFSLRDDELVLAHDAEDRADSNSTDWDIAFQATNIIVNGGVSGPGEGAAYVAEAAFEEVQEVETSRLQADTESGRALGGWYNYNASTHVITPVPGRTLVVRTADGEGYAKLRIQSYYDGAPADPASSEADARYYTFDYVVRTDGETAFE